MSNFAILRVAKLHTRRQLRDASRHNDRTAEHGLEHVAPLDDPALIAGEADVVAAWDAKMAAAGVDPKKQRKDGVVALEWVATASPEFFATATIEQRTKWATESMAFIIDQAGGADNVLAVYIHEDETTPHIHALTIPLVKKVRGAKGRPRKDREAAQRAPQKAWGLSAAEFIGGGSARLSEMQTAYAEAVAGTGLQRGIPRKETGARNKSPAHWRAEQARLTDEAAVDRAAAQEGLNRAADTALAARAMARVVQADAARLGEAIHFPDYATDPTTREARAAVAKALVQRNPATLTQASQTATQRINEAIAVRTPLEDLEWQDDAPKADPSHSLIRPAQGRERSR